MVKKRQQHGHLTFVLHEVVWEPLLLLVLRWHRVLTICDNLSQLSNHVFNNNCLISRALIGSFLSSIRVQTDKILIYASFQVQLSALKLSTC